MSRQKQQGTSLETAIVRDFQALGIRSWRYAEGGSQDIGDVGAYADRERVHEAKFRERLNVHDALHKAMGKAAPHPCTLVWKKLTKKAGNARRTPDGVAQVAVMAWDDYLHLMWLVSQARDYGPLSEQFANVTEEV